MTSHATNSTKHSGTAKASSPRAESKGSPTGKPSGKPASPTVPVTTPHERAKYRAVLESTVDPDIDVVGDIIAHSGVDDTSYNQVRDRPAKVEVSIKSNNVIFHSDMNSTTPTVGNALNSVWVRLHGVGTKMESGSEVFYREDRVTHTIKSLQTWLTRQGARDSQIHWVVPFKLDALPDDYSNGTTQRKSHSHSALDSLPAKGKLISTTSKPGGADKGYVTKLFENINDTNPAGSRPHDLYVKVLEFVVSVDENAKFGATSKQAEALGITLSCMMREEVNPSGQPSTAPDIFVEAAKFTPHNWPSILPPVASAANVGEIKLTVPSTSSRKESGPDIVSASSSRLSPLGGRLGRSLRLNENYIYTISASIFGIVQNDSILCPRYAFVKNGYVFFALNEKDAMMGNAVSAPGAVIPHATTFRPMIPRTGAYGAVNGEFAGAALPFGKIVQLVN